MESDTSTPLSATGWQSRLRLPSAVQSARTAQACVLQAQTPGTPAGVPACVCSVVATNLERVESLAVATGAASVREYASLVPDLLDASAHGSLESRAFQPWGHSSAGRAPAWHAGGRRFDPGWLHQISSAGTRVTSPSSRGLGQYPFTVATGVRIPVGTPLQTPAQAGVFFFAE